MFMHALPLTCLSALLLPSQPPTFSVSHREGLHRISTCIHLNTSRTLCMRDPDSIQQTQHVIAIRLNPAN